MSEFTSTSLPPSPNPSAATTQPQPRALPNETGWRWWLRLPLIMARNARNTWREHRLLFIVIGFATAFFVAYWWHDMVVKIKSGESGVLYRLFAGGTVVGQDPYGEGLHLVLPWNEMYIYTARIQQVTDEFLVLSNDGLEVQVIVSIRYRPHLPDLGMLHKNIGPDYVEKVVKPEIQAQFRFALGQYKPDEIYSSQGFILQMVVQGALQNLAERHIELDDLLLKSVKLPRSVADSIESKLRAQQLAQEMKYRVETEVEEAKRKRIEAEGIRDFQQIITAGGSPEDFLRFKGIEATLELARSPNAKVIIAGGGTDRLPLLFDTSTAAGVTPTTRAPAAAGSQPAAPVSPPGQR
jgi:regulator of protease activity HflC (stomatin/prohibitin superfamily)